MEKAGFSYKLPDMSNVAPRVDRARNFPEGEFVAEVYKLRPKLTRAGDTAVIAEFKVVEIVHQEIAKTKEGATLPLITVGQRVDHYMQFGGQYGYGEAEWANLMDALGVPVAERNAAQKTFLGEENLACGLQVRVRCSPPKTYFNAIAK